MKILLTKIFYFSASHSQAGKIFGHNYALGVTTRVVDQDSERLLEEKVNGSLIRRIHSRDLGLHVDFLKEVAINDQNLLEVFWKILERDMRPLILLKLTLAKDERTQVAMEQMP